MKMDADTKRDLKQASVGIVAAAALAIIAACATAQKIMWPTAVKCGPQIAEAIGEVTGVLIGGGDWQSALEAIARKRGVEAVICAADSVSRSWSEPGASHDDRVVAANKRAREFLGGINVNR